jgi:hypothetical protein
MTFKSYFEHTEPIFQELQILNIYKVNDYLGATSIFILPPITSNRRYEWVGWFLRQLLDVNSWQFDYLHPNRQKFKRQSL